MEISQVNSLSFISNKLKYHVFHFSFLFYSPTKLENRGVEQVLPRREDGTSGRGEVLGKGVGV
jgi:hypothetical protein